MDPAALEKAFEMYPEVKLVVSAELYGFAGDIKKIKESWYFVEERGHVKWPDSTRL